MNGTLPHGWAWASAEDVARQRRHALAIGPFGSNLKVVDYRSSGVPLVFVRHIRAERFVETYFVSEAKARELASHSVTGGDVLITKMGEPPGDSAMYPLHLPDGVITADCIKWSIDPRIGHPKFFMYAIRTAEMRQRIIAITQGVAQKKVSLGRFRTIKFPCAPRAEQARVVEVLDLQHSRLDAAIASLDGAQAKLKAYRASVLKAAVEGRLVPTEAELARRRGDSYERADLLLGRILAERRRRWEEAKLAKMKTADTRPKDDRWKTKYEEPAAPDISERPELPEGWCWATTDQLFWFVTSGSRGWAKYYSESGATFIRIGNLDHDSIGLDLSEIQHVSPPRGSEGTRTRVVPSDVLISITADVGMIGLVPDRISEAYINQHIGLARPVRGFCVPYLAWFLAATHGGQRQFLSLQRGATKVGLGLDDIRMVHVPLPPLAEQQRIVDEIERCFSVAASCQAAIATNALRTERLRQAILKWAFQGKLVDPDSTDEPAATLLERLRTEHAAAGPAKKARNRRLKVAS